jgi:hypothetical protein
MLTICGIDPRGALVVPCRIGENCRTKSGNEKPDYSVRPDGARHQWRKIPSRELSIDLVADERLVRVTERVEAS